MSIGRSVEGREQIVVANFDLKASRPEIAPTLLIGGVHGDEPATVLLLEAFIERYLLEIAEPVAVLSLCNPDGYRLATRYNARHVDLNRNCGFRWCANSLEPAGPAPWSEPEICAVRDFIEQWRPGKVVSLHWALAELDADGPQSTPCALAMWGALNERERSAYRLRVTPATRDLEGSAHSQELECPGSLGQWCAYGFCPEDGLAPAMITLELPYDPALDCRPAILPEDHLETLRVLWKRDSESYLREVGVGVFKMLAAACRFAGES